MNQYYIEHSSGPWKKHKYLKKIGEGPSAVYTYAKSSIEYNSAKKRKKKADAYLAETDQDLKEARDALGNGKKVDKAHKKLAGASVDNNNAKQEYSAAMKKYKADRKSGNTAAAKKSYAEAQKKKQKYDSASRKLSRARQQSHDANVGYFNLYDVYEKNKRYDAAMDESYRADKNYRSKKKKYNAAKKRYKKTLVGRVMGRIH